MADRRPFSNPGHPIAWHCLCATPALHPPQIVCCNHCRAVRPHNPGQIIGLQATARMTSSPPPQWHRSEHGYLPYLPLRHAPPVPSTPGIIGPNNFAFPGHGNSNFVQPSNILQSSNLPMPGTSNAYAGGMAAPTPAPFPGPAHFPSRDDIPTSPFPQSNVARPQFTGPNLARSFSENYLTVPSTAQMQRLVQQGYQATYPLQYPPPQAQPPAAHMQRPVQQGPQATYPLQSTPTRNHTSRIPRAVPTSAGSARTTTQDGQITRRSLQVGPHMFGSSRQGNSAVPTGVPRAFADSESGIAGVPSASDGDDDGKHDVFARMCISLSRAVRNCVLPTTKPTRPVPDELAISPTTADPLATFQRLDIAPQRATGEAQERPSLSTAIDFGSGLAPSLPGLPTIPPKVDRAPITYPTLPILPNPSGLVARLDSTIVGPLETRKFSDGFKKNKLPERKASGEDAESSQRPQS